MRNKIIVLFLCALIIPVHFSFAVYTPNLGTQSNPLYIQAEQDPTQLWQSAWDKINSMQYVSACASKYDSVKSLASKNGFGNIADPYTAKSAANYLNYLYSSYQLCLTNAAQQTQVQQVKPQATQSVNILDQVCQKSFGSQSIYTGKAKNEGGNTGGCSCVKGYGWNNDMGKCILESKETNDLLCFNKFGEGIIWDGTKNNAGEPVCACKSGYEVKDNKCILITVKINNNVCSKGYSKNGKNECVENNQLCKNDFGENTKWGGKINEKNGPICDCEIGYVWNKEGTLCVISETKQDQEVVDPAGSNPVSLDSNVAVTDATPKHKNLWEKIKGWFGL